MQSWFSKASVKRTIISSLMATLTIGLLGFLTQHTGYMVILPSFGATCAIIFITPTSRLARPLSIFGGHILTSIIGILIGRWCGSSWWALALAVGAAVLLMQSLDIVHPPAAANPLLIMLQGVTDWGFVITPVLVGSLLLAVITAAYRCFCRQELEYQEVRRILQKNI
ncbi:MAG: HPP family protein [Methylocystaceae bacterium]